MSELSISGSSDSAAGFPEASETMSDSATVTKTVIFSEQPKQLEKESGRYMGVIYLLLFASNLFISLSILSFHMAVNRDLQSINKKLNVLYEGLHNNDKLLGQQIMLVGEGLTGNLDIPQTCKPVVEAPGRQPSKNLTANDLSLKSLTGSE